LIVVATEVHCRGNEPVVRPKAMKLHMNGKVMDLREMGWELVDLGVMPQSQPKSLHLLAVYLPFFCLIYLI
jgi:hypothetical protein